MKATALPKLTEAEFLRQVIALARLYRYRVYHTRDSRGSDPGFPDLVCVREDTVGGVRFERDVHRLVFIELKVEPNTLTKAQAAWVNDLRAAGQTVLVAYPSQWKEIESVLKGGGA